MMARPAYKRAERVADQIRMEVADILARKTKDPRVGFVTVTDVELSNDLRVARIYVTTMQQGQQQDQDDETFKGLESAIGFIRIELGRRLALRYTPELIFCQDGSRPRAERVLQLLEEFHHNEKSENS